MIKKNKKIILFISILLVFLIVLVILNPLKLFKSKANALMPANTAFDDINFYTCVVGEFISSSSSEDVYEMESEMFDSLNFAYKIKYSTEKYQKFYNKYLSDENLKQLNDVTCNLKVNGTKGIEKLINIKSLNLDLVEADKLDLSSLKNLERFKLYGGEIGEVVLPKNSEFENIFASDTTIGKLDISMLSNESSLSLGNSTIDTLILNEKQANYWFKYHLFDRDNTVKEYIVDGKSYPGMNKFLPDYQQQGSFYVINKEMSLEKFKNTLPSNFTITKCVKYSVNNETDCTSDNNFIVGDNSAITVNASYPWGEYSYKLYIKVFDNQFFNDFYVFQNVLHYYYMETGTLKDDLTLEELLEIKQLDLSGYEINDLTGLEKMTNLEDLEIDSLLKSNITEIDLSPLIKLKNLRISSKILKKIKIKGLEKLKDLEYLELENIELDDLDVTNNKNLNILFSFFKTDSINASNLPNLKYLVAQNNDLKSLDVTGSYQLMAIDATANSLKKIKGLEELTNLEYAYLGLNDFNKLDLSKNKSLQHIVVGNNNFSDNREFLIKDEVVPYKDPVILPENFPDYGSHNEDDSIIKYENGNIKALKVGESTFNKIYFDEVFLDEFGEDGYLFPTRTEYIVYDMTSSKYTINKEKKYVYVGEEKNDKAIKRYTKIKGLSFSKKIENDKIKILYENEEIGSFNIIKVTSEKYDLNGDIIKYKNNFNIDDIKITNARLNIVENYLQIIYDDTIVKTFELVKEE